MNIFIFRNGQQEGPYDVESIKKLNITPDTLVWYKGLSAWIKASQADATAAIFNQIPPYPTEPAPQPQYQQPQPEPQPQYQQPQYQPEQYPQQPQYQQSPTGDYDMPATNSGIAMATMILGICCCCNIVITVLGIIAYMKSRDVQKLYMQGDVEGAQAASKMAKTLSFIGLGLWIVGTIFGIFWGFINGMLSSF